MPEKVGRPNKIDEITLQKLEEAFSNGATDREACFIASISQQTLYNYQEKNPEFIERKASLKDMIKYQAKANIAGAVRGNGKEALDTAKWYAERKLKDEFSPRIENTGKDGKDLQIQVVNYNKDEDNSTT